METSDHWPCVVEIDTKIPRTRIQDLKIIGSIMMILPRWPCKVDFTTRAPRPCQRPNCNIQNLRKTIKSWSVNLPKLSLLIEKIKLVLHFLEAIEEIRDLSLP